MAAHKYTFTRQVSVYGSKTVCVELSENEVQCMCMRRRMCMCTCF